MLPADVSDLIPQKFPFKMVDFLLEAGEIFTKTTFLIAKDNVLVQEGLFSEGGMIENMAQSAAAGSGYFFSQQATSSEDAKSVPVGYIGAVKGVKILKLPAVGEEIQTELETLNKIGNASIVSAKIFHKKELLGSCELTIFVQQT